MKNFFFIAMIAILVVSCSSTKSTWGGFATQDDAKGIAATYPMQVKMQKHGNKVCGTALYFIADDPSVYAVMKFKGTVENNVYKISETEVVDAAKIYGTWLTKNFDLKFEEIEGITYLTGKWKAQSNASYYGTIKIKETVKQ